MVRLPMSTPSRTTTDQLTFDLDSDGVPDIIIEDTNGKTIYVNLKWFVAAGFGLVTTVLTALGIWQGVI